MPLKSHVTNKSSYQSNNKWANFMDYLTLTNNTKMLLIGLGTWDLRGKECIDNIIKAIQLGYRLIDTAQMYENEKEVGIAIKQSGIDRNEWNKKFR
mgnify:CR=1 FL=1